MRPVFKIFLVYPIMGAMFGAWAAFLIFPAFFGMFIGAWVGVFTGLPFVVLGYPLFRGKSIDHAAWFLILFMIPFITLLCLVFDPRLLWPLSVAGFAALNLIVARMVPDSLPAEGFCSCGYDLTGNTSGTCPECGAALQ